MIDFYEIELNLKYTFNYDIRTKQKVVLTRTEIKLKLNSFYYHITYFIILCNLYFYTGYMNLNFRLELSFFSFLFVYIVTFVDV